MPVLSTFLPAAVVIVLLLWFNGRQWREQKGAEFPRVTVHSPKYADNSTGVVSFDGAFNYAEAHYPELRDAVFCEVGTLYEVQYGTSMFDEELAVDAAMRSIDLDQHKKVVVVGASMGIVPAMMTVERILQCSPDTEVSLLGIDPAASLESLPSMFQTLIEATNWMRPGPVWNFLLGTAIRAAMFKPLPESQRQWGYNKRLLEAHYAARMRCEPSAILSMNGAIKRSFQPINSASFEQVEAVFLFSTEDGVLDTVAAKREIQTRFPNATMCDVEGGHHVDFLENPKIWLQAIKEGLETLVGKFTR